MSNKIEFVNDPWWNDCILYALSHLAPERIEILLTQALKIGNKECPQTGAHEENNQASWLPTRCGLNRWSYGRASKPEATKKSIQKTKSPCAEKCKQVLLGFCFHIILHNINRHAVRVPVKIQALSGVFRKIEGTLSIMRCHFKSSV